MQNQLGSIAVASHDVRGLSPQARRMVEIVPGAAALTLVSGMFWGYALAPNFVAAFLLLFAIYWLWKSTLMAVYALKGIHLMRSTLRRSPRGEYRRIAAEGGALLPWEAVRHIVIIPCYRESQGKIAATLAALARSAIASTSIVPVLAMEAAEDGSKEKACLLAYQFRHCFLDILVTVHPRGIAGEVPGKASNENWAARRAYEELIDRQGWEPDCCTITSCDADSIIHRRYFEHVTLAFATDPNRHRRFWQAPIFFYSNIWQVPGPLRVPNALSGLIHLSRLARRRPDVFPVSTYSLSLQAAKEAGFWDPDTIPEDWRMFMKCFYAFGGDVTVVPVLVPIWSDGALSSSWKRTLVNHYTQVHRWSWGVSDLPYLLNAAITHEGIPLRRQLRRALFFLETHLLWSTQWFFLSLGGVAPWVVGLFAAENVAPAWVQLNSHLGGGFVPDMVTLPALFTTPCLVPYLVLIVLDSRLRPRPPANLTRRSRISALVWWVAISPITLFASCLPALHAQIRLMLGCRLEYRVTEKV